MQIGCPSCGNYAEISGDLIDDDGTKMTCPECDIDFVALPGGFTAPVEEMKSDSESDSQKDSQGSKEDNPTKEQGVFASEEEESPQPMDTRPIQEALKEAAKQDEEEIEVSVQDLDQLGESRREFLLCHVAPEVESGGAELAEVLIELGTDPNTKDEDGKPVLHYAAENGKPEVVKVLIENGADPNERGYTPRTPLHWSAREDSKDVAEVLIEAGADVEAEDERTGVTPLHTAARGGSKQVLEILLDAGANLDAEAVLGFSQGSTPIHFAAGHGEVEVAESLLKAGSEVDAKSRKKKTPLHEAAFGGHIKMIELLLREGADVESLNDKGQSPLGLAIPTADNILGVAKVLVEAGVPLDSGGSLKGTPLHDAAHDCGPELVEYLIDAGSDVNAMNEFGKTPLDQVVFRKSDGDPAPRVKRLLSREGAKLGESISRGGSQAQGCLGFF